MPSFTIDDYIADAKALVDQIQGMTRSYVSSRNDRRYVAMRNRRAPLFTDVWFVPPTPFAKDTWSPAALLLEVCEPNMPATEKNQRYILLAAEDGECYQRQTLEFLDVAPRTDMLVLIAPDWAPVYVPGFEDLHIHAEARGHRFHPTPKGNMFLPYSSSRGKEETVVRSISAATVASAH